VEFIGADGGTIAMDKLLLPEEFEGHPLRKDFVLASRVAKPFPGAKEPGESDHQAAAPSRRRTRPAGVPEPDQWGPRPPGPRPEPPEKGRSANRSRSSVARRPGPSTADPPSSSGSDGPPPASGGEDA
jgi:NADH-quinone oxidoreductase subunit C